MNLELLAILELGDGRRSIVIQENFLDVTFELMPNLFDRASYLLT